MFKPGDKIICVDSTGMDTILIAGRIYTVLCMYHAPILRILKLEGVNYPWLSARRFISADSNFTEMPCESLSTLILDLSRKL